MQYRSSVFGDLLKPIDRRRFRQIVERHNGDAYDKSFKSWEHLVTLVGAQLGGVASLRGVALTLNANSHQHYHLGIGKIAKSTLSDANRRRPVGVFADTFAMLAELAGVQQPYGARRKGQRSERLTRVTIGSQRRFSLLP